MQSPVEGGLDMVVPRPLVRMRQGKRIRRDETRQGVVTEPVLRNRERGNEWVVGGVDGELLEGGWCGLENGGGGHVGWL